MAYIQKNNPVPKTGCGRRRLSGMKNPFKKVNDKSLAKISKELKKASNLHAGQAKKIDKMVGSSPAKFGLEDRGIDSAARGTKAIGPDGKPLKMKSPMKGKLKPCQKAAARKKFDVYPSAYANMWASNHKC
jgi:hypothetical protein